MGKTMRCQYIPITENKGIEIAFSSQTYLRSYFGIDIQWNIKQDHAGFYCYLSLYKWAFEFNICDKRHWDRVMNRWKLEPYVAPVPKEDNWEDQLGV